MPWSQFFECWALSQLFHSSSLTFFKRLLVPLQFLPLEWYHLYIWGYFLFPKDVIQMLLHYKSLCSVALTSSFFFLGSVWPLCAFIKFYSLCLEWSPPLVLVEVCICTHPCLYVSFSASERWIEKWINTKNATLLKSYFNEIRSFAWIIFLLYWIEILRSSNHWLKKKLIYP